MIFQKVIKFSGSLHIKCVNILLIYKIDVTTLYVNVQSNLTYFKTTYLITNNLNSYLKYGILNQY